MNEEKMNALIAWEEAAREEINECKKEMEAKHALDRAALARSELSMKTRIAEERYRMLGGKTI